MFDGILDGNDERILHLRELYFSYKLLITCVKVSYNWIKCDKC